MKIDNTCELSKKNENYEPPELDIDEDEDYQDYDYEGPMGRD